MHSLRLASGAEALAARVRIADAGGRRATGYGFTLNDEAIVARDMAAWDALAIARGLPLHALFGAQPRATIPVCAAPAAEALLLDPWRCLTLEELRRRATAAHGPVALLAPNAHPWELAWCAAVAAGLPRSAPCVVAAGRSGELVLCESPGHGLDWSLEPGWARLNWTGED
ncbi:MAG: hypothetical protein IPK29_19905 [Betaproteobacteria bacterium]|nr:hypothetical protein [Betaproteobacteria bacterium]